MTHATSLSRKVADYAVITLFMVGLCLPTVDRLFQIDPALKLTENRVLTTLPEWPSTLAAAFEFPQKFDAYWNDNFGLRRVLIRCNAWTRYKMGVTSTPLVVVGKDNWLFFTGDQAQESHRGLHQFSAIELENWRDELQARHDWTERRGIHYLLVIAPDKQSIYPENLPAHLANASATPLDQLMEVLAKHSTVNVLDLRNSVANEKSANQVFWRSDSHWNDQGEYIGYREILRRLRQWSPELEPIPFSQFRRVQVGTWSGDLAAMIGLIGSVVEPQVELEPLFPWSSHPASAPGDPPAGSMKYSAWEGPSAQLPRAVVVHDSYLLTPSERNIASHTNSIGSLHSEFDLVRLLAGHFSRSVFSWQMPFDAEFIEREKPKFVIHEVVERLLSVGPQGRVPRD